MDGQLGRGAGCLSCLFYDEYEMIDDCGLPTEFLREEDLV